ncbi:MAG TPA: DUF6279 family lipoprotein [Fontimonas sp.]
MVGLSLLLGACSAARLAYERLDWLARWKVNSYVSLTEAQTAHFDAGFAEAWRWHRTQELPQWIAELRQLAAAVDAPLSAEQIDALTNRYSASAERTLARLAPLACAIGVSLSDQQVEELLDAVDDDIEEFREEQVEPSDAAVRRFNLKKLEKTLRRNLGALTPAQQAQIQAWNDARPSAAAAGLAYRERWRSALATQLAQRQDPAFCAALTALITDGEALASEAEKRVFAANRAQWQTMFVELAPTLGDAQREHLRERLATTADELAELLAARPE